ncbi:Zinc finger CCCH-type [Trinorchestia longiramus]|nr:Zinc finger CCCH-type [Trinorchestia longiramus]
MEGMETADPVALSNIMDETNTCRGINQKDCFFYYYSSCTKGDACPYRHEPAAIGNKAVCRYWAKGLCVKPMCAFRHLEVTQPQNKVPCYFEKQPGGCKRNPCPFFHNSDLDQSSSEVNASKTTSPKTSCGNSPNTSRSNTPLPWHTNFIINVTESDSDDDDHVPQPISKRPKSTAENVQQEIRLINEIQRIQAKMMGYPFPVKDCFRSISPKQPEPMFVDEVEDVVEEVPDDTPKNFSPVSTPLNRPMSPLFKISVIGSVREDARSTSTPMNGLQRPVLTSTPDQANKMRLQVVVKTPTGSHVEVRERRARPGGVASTILARRVRMRSKPITPQHSTEASLLKNNSVYDRLQGPISAFKDVRNNFTSANYKCESKDFESDVAYNNSKCGPSDDDVRTGGHYGSSVRTNSNDDEYPQRRKSQAYRRVKNPPNGCTENLMSYPDSQVRDSCTSSSLSNGFIERDVSPLDGIRIKSLEEIRRDKATKQAMQTSRNSNNFFHQRSSVAREQRGNERIRHYPEAQSFIPSVLSHRDKSLALRTSFSSNEDLNRTGRDIFHPDNGITQEEGSYYGGNS